MIKLWLDNNSLKEIYKQNNFLVDEDSFGTNSKTVIENSNHDGYKGLSNFSKAIIVTSKNVKLKSFLDCLP